MRPLRLNPLDAAWILTEARATPNHVGGLLQFRLPEGAPRDFLRKLMAEFRDHREFQAPWNRRLKYPLSVNPMPVWVEADDIDLEYHVRHAALPWPGGERELGELVGRLQSTPLDLSRPPWECTIIEGLEGDRFALVHQGPSLADRRRERHEAAAAGDVARPQEEPRDAAVLGLRPGARGEARARRSAGDFRQCRRGRGRTRCAGRCRRCRSSSPRSARSSSGSAIRTKAWSCPSTRRARCSTAACARSGASPRSSSRWSACARWPRPPTARSTTSCWRSAAARCGASCWSATACRRSR